MYVVCYTDNDFKWPTQNHLIANANLFSFPNWQTYTHTHIPTLTTHMHTQTNINTHAYTFNQLTNLSHKYNHKHYTVFSKSKTKSTNPRKNQNDIQNSLFKIPYRAIFLVVCNISNLNLFLNLELCT